MSSSLERAAARARALVAPVTLALTLVAASAVMAQGGTFQGIGRAATPKELAAWDIDVRPDFKGLPKGSGSVAKGMEVWEAKCASCHGIFGESNQVFSPLVGGTTAEDVKSGRVARLTDVGFPSRTTLMKVATVSTLWDYIRRAMPWNQPKSLSVDEVYAVTAYLLNLGSVLPDNFVLSDANIAEVQKLMPNRNGMTTDHGLWPGGTLGQRGKPDVRAAACMSDCGGEPKVASFVPEYARDAHGNLAEQQRLVGPQHGAQTAAAAAETGGAAAAAATPADTSAQALARKHNCLTCHGVENKVVGPAFRDVAKKYAGRADAVSYFARKIAEGGSGVWGTIPMPAQGLPPTDLKAIGEWLAAGAP